ncbi:MAG: lactate utilization protein [Lachnospiraceae bacterium]
MQIRTKPMEKRYDKLGPTVVKAFKKRHFDAYYCQTGEDAVKQVLDLIPETDVVAWGGSKTMTQLGILEQVKKRNTVIDRDSAATPQERMELMRKALLCDTFLMSSNAISEDGQLYNIDGHGNRLAALIFGPGSVIVVAGMNKVVKTIADAESRVRNLAAPTNAQGFDVATPCNVNGACSDCLSSGCICSAMVRTRISRPAGKIKVILVGENLGV